MLMLMLFYNYFKMKNQLKIVQKIRGYCDKDVHLTIMDYLRWKFNIEEGVIRYKKLQKLIKITQDVLCKERIMNNFMFLDKLEHISMNEFEISDMNRLMMREMKSPMRVRSQMKKFENKLKNKMLPSAVPEPEHVNNY